MSSAVTLQAQLITTPMYQYPGCKRWTGGTGKEIENEKGYTTDLLTQYAVDFIVRHKTEPFFLYLAHEAPHTPLQGRDPSEKKSRADTYKEMIEVLDESVAPSSGFCASIASRRAHC